MQGYSQSPLLETARKHGPGPRLQNDSVGPGNSPRSEFCFGS
jgi:hypothetical protein